MARTITETIYYVSDLQEGVKFYTENLGFVAETVQDWGWAELRLDGQGAKIGLLLESAVRKPGDIYPVPRVGIRTDDIDGEVAALKQKGVKVDELRGEPGSMRAVNFYDLDGNAFFLWDDGNSF